MDDGSEGTGIEGHESDPEEARGRRLTWLWASPWLLILGFCIWHFAAPEVAHLQARAAWRQDRAKLSTAYSRMAEANLRDDIESYGLAAQNADTALDNLQTDLGKLAGSEDQGRRTQFLQGSRDCVGYLGFELTPLKSNPSDYCINLIANAKP
jgi:hypothetical protein